MTKDLTLKIETKKNLVNDETSQKFDNFYKALSELPVTLPVAFTISGQNEIKTEVNIGGFIVDNVKRHFNLEQ
jgi:hypothetical protein